MMPTLKGSQHGLADFPDLVPSLPLYKRAPRQDENGKPLSDFMMIIPKLRTRPQPLIKETVAKIEKVLERYAGSVVFADLNLKLNVLWVIVRPERGICSDIPCAINNAVPEALLVAHPRL
jgi:hypothetical protein